MTLEGDFAHYRIVGRLGAGGMGEVYQAEDTRLGRKVALKVLPADLADDAERISRFRREAQILAALQHPRIAAIHGVEEVEGRMVLFGVMRQPRLALAWLAVTSNLRLVRRLHAARRLLHDLRDGEEPHRKA